jgi:hypothetical protein
MRALKIAVIAGVALFALDVFYVTHPRATTGPDAIEARMRSLLTPGTPWAQVEHVFAENKVEHSALLDGSRAYAMIRNADSERPGQVNLALELAFDEHNNLRDVQFRKTYSRSQ